MLTTEEISNLDHFEIEWYTLAIAIVYPDDAEYDELNEYESDLTAADLALIES